MCTTANSMDADTRTTRSERITSPYARKPRLLVELCGRLHAVLLDDLAGLHQEIHLPQNVDYAQRLAAHAEQADSMALRAPLSVWTWQATFRPAFAASETKNFI